MRVTRPQKLVVFALLAVGCAGGDVDPWAPGELLIEQIGLTGEAIGEAALVVGPDGTTVLIDVGNDAHAERVLDALERHGDGAAVDWVLLTHYHADHIGGFDKLFDSSAANGGEPTEVRQKVLIRGLVDIDDGGANCQELEAVCSWMSENPGHSVGLCLSEPPLASCSAAAAGGPWSATSCGGINGATNVIPLGDGAQLTVFAVNGWADTGDGVEPIHDLDGRHDDAGENGRSMVGVIRHGEFAMVFGGDLTGGGKGTPDVEAAVAAAAGRDDHPVPAGGVDVIQLNHHGIDSSSGDAWLDWLLPDDGSLRHAMVGASSAYISAPDRDVVDRVLPRLPAAPRPRH